MLSKKKQKVGPSRAAAPAKCSRCKDRVSTHEHGPCDDKCKHSHCGARFCSVCIDEWLLDHKLCPVCNQNILMHALPVRSSVNASDGDSEEEESDPICASCPKVLQKGFQHCSTCNDHVPVKQFPKHKTSCPASVQNNKASRESVTHPPPEQRNAVPTPVIDQGQAPPKDQLQSVDAKPLKEREAKQKPVAAATEQQKPKEVPKEREHAVNEKSKEPQQKKAEEKHPNEKQAERPAPVPAENRNVTPSYEQVPCTVCKRNIYTFMVHCPFCAYHINETHYRTHLEACSKDFRECPRGCGQRVARTRQRDHERIACIRASSTTAKSQVAAQLPRQLSTPTLCPRGCGALVAADRQEIHDLYHCPNMRLFGQQPFAPLEMNKFHCMLIQIPDLRAKLAAGREVFFSPHLVLGPLKWYLKVERRSTIPEDHFVTARFGVVPRTSILKTYEVVWKATIISDGSRTVKMFQQILPAWAPYFHLDILAPWRGDFALIIDFCITHEVVPSFIGSRSETAASKSMPSISASAGVPSATGVPSAPMRAVHSASAASLSASHVSSAIAASNRPSSATGETSSVSFSSSASTAVSGAPAQSAHTCSTGSAAASYLLPTQPLAVASQISKAVPPLLPPSAVVRQPLAVLSSHISNLSRPSSQNALSTGNAAVVPARSVIAGPPACVNGQKKDSVVPAAAVSQAVPAKAEPKPVYIVID